MWLSAAAASTQRPHDIDAWIAVTGAPLWTPGEIARPRREPAR
jgi:hypothetical protein